MTTPIHEFIPPQGERLTWKQPNGAVFRAGDTDNGAGAPKNYWPQQLSSESHTSCAYEPICPKQNSSSGNDFEGIIGRSAVMRTLCKNVKLVAPTGSTALILGETGTGKELIARAVHNLSPRRDRPFVKVNCAAIPAGLIESELFGHERGAFTGAAGPRTGRFEMANGGTLFLDEIGDITLELQPKLLRVLQEQEFERVGSSQTTRVDVRIVAATSRDLRQMVVGREFRADLYYRLNVLPLRVPALRERPEDVPPLVQHFMELYSKRANKRITEVPVEAMEVLVSYHWPGNVRELQNVVERAVILSQGKVLRLALDELRPSTRLSVAAGVGKSDDLTTLKDVEREHILRTLAETNRVLGGPKGAAARLGLARTTLIAKMKKLGITRLQA
jgi:formate hydrogenlyase transcriptional activator